MGGDKLGKQRAREEDKDCGKKSVKIVGGVKERRGSRRWEEEG